jgi:hypothetical protein
MDEQPGVSADALREEPSTRPQAVALFWARCAAVAKQMAELRRLQAYIAEKWGRAPRLPKW